MSLHHAGKPEDAISFYLKALKIDTESAETLNNLGIALDEAIRSYKKAIAIDPGYAQAHNNLGSALHSIHRMQEAIDSFRQAILIRPDFVEAHNNLGLALLAEKRYEEAHLCFDKALAVQPGFIDAYLNSGNTFREQGLYSQALRRFKKALELDPNRYDIHAHMAYVLTLQGRMDEAIRSYQEALKTAPKDNSIHSPYLFALHYQDPVDFSELYRQHKQWGKLQKAANPRTRVHDKTPRRRLRIGYVSPDFHTHSVGYFIETILASHDKDSFEIFCYSDVSFPDETTKRMQSLIKNWRDISLLRDRQVEGMIQQDRIDILVDLAGHTANNRLTLFASGPAPVQATYLGYPDTTGLPGMHYRITDALADPPGMTDHLYTEKLVRLPGCFLCYRPPAPTPDVGPPPCRKTGRTTFGSFNNRSKITRNVIRVWSEILKKIPDSMLLLKAKPFADTDTRQALLEEFSRQGVQPGQIEFAGRIESPIEHLELYNSIDIALDTFPYNGTTTTCEALWMGVPVIILKGEAHMSRVGVSLLTNMGMEEFITETPHDYVEKAMSLAKNPKNLSRLRQRQRNAMSRSPLMDGHNFTRNLERAYQKMWLHWCSRANEPLPGSPRAAEDKEPRLPEKYSNEEQALAANQEGEQLFCNGRMEDALRAFTRALEIDPSCLPALNNLGVVHWHTNNIPSAMQCFEHVLSLDPGNEDAVYNLQQIRTGHGCVDNGLDRAPA
jgi:predicted O-linked N-acetylglucosamine transferase (SPINDLY family)